MQILIFDYKWWCCQLQEMFDCIYIVTFNWSILQTVCLVGRRCICLYFGRILKQLYLCLHLVIYLEVLIFPHLVHLLFSLQFRRTKKTILFSPILYIHTLYSCNTAIVWIVVGLTTLIAFLWIVGVCLCLFLSQVHLRIDCHLVVINSKYHV